MPSTYWLGQIKNLLRLVWYTVLLSWHRLRVILGPTCMPRAAFLDTCCHRVFLRANPCILTTGIVSSVTLWRWLIQIATHRLILLMKVLILLLLHFLHYRLLLEELLLFLRGQGPYISQFIDCLEGRFAERRSWCLLMTLLCSIDILIIVFHEWVFRERGEPSATAQTRGCIEIWILSSVSNWFTWWHINNYYFMFKFITHSLTFSLT